MPLSDYTTESRRLDGVYQHLLDRERNNVDPRLHFGKPPEAARLIRLFGPRARPARLARLERGEPTLIPHWGIGGNYFPEARDWPNYRDRANIRGWEVRPDDSVVPVGHDDPRWDEPGNRL